MKRFLPVIPPIVLGLSAILPLSGCEEVEEPVSTSEVEGAGAQSTLGKANERAERLKAEIDAYQQEVIRQADTVFDDGAARAAERANEGSGTP
jgi:hypothetical protein